MVYDTINPEIVNFVLKGAPRGARILDVGCGTGKLAAALKQKLPCHICGIEIDKEAADKARSSCDEVMVIDLENVIGKSSGLGSAKKYDLVILGDVLEHLTRPEILLQSLHDLLEDNGFMVVSLPNVANWMIRFGLLFGNFDYSGGVLDCGHLKFFTYKSARRLLQDNGYRIVAVINNNHTLPVRLLGRIWMKMFAFQFVFKCVKSI